MAIDVQFICPLCQPAGLCTFQCQSSMDADARRQAIEARTFIIGSVMAYCRDKPNITPDQLHAFLEALLSHELNG